MLISSHGLGYPITYRFELQRTVTPHLRTFRAQPLRSAHLLFRQFVSSDLRISSNYSQSPACWLSFFRRRG